MTQLPAHPSADFPLPKFLTHPSAVPVPLWVVAESAKRHARSEQRPHTTQPRTKNGGQRGERGWAGQDKGCIVTTDRLEALDGQEPLPQPKCTALANHRLFAAAGRG